jgi:hypothetical protein
MSATAFQRARREAALREQEEVVEEVQCDGESGGEGEEETQTTGEEVESSTEATEASIEDTSEVEATPARGGRRARN